MLKSLLIIGSLTLFFLFSCKGQQNGATTNSSNMEVLVKDNYGGHEKERFLLIKDQKSLAEFYGQFNRTRKPGLPVPDIDFNKEMILVWSPGEQNGNSDLKIKSHAGKNLILRKTKLKKDKEFTAITRPVTIYRLSNNADSIVIE
ncbi:hypothetical protein [Maribacter sp. LLG6340-A2]|uniref:hypothetical protein n=1 Tax=Maribacter sp. LLG6340-A2 TaxID=3160834 RepID=UPI0038645BD2